MIRKNILISGASSGLGMGMARQFAAMDRNLALCARRLDRLEALRNELLAAQPTIKVVVSRLDVNDHDAVFSVFREMRDTFGTLDRVIVNAGRARGRPLGTGSFDLNKQIIETNLVAALAQAEAAMEIFREQQSGHLVMISSVAAMIGLPHKQTTYAASKAGVSALAEGLRIEMLGMPMVVTAIRPGFIRSEMNEHLDKARFRVDTDKGCRLLVRAIEREPASASVPAWPWGPIGFVMRHLPLKLKARQLAGNL